jgi:hypothetical protein
MKVYGIENLNIKPKDSQGYELKLGDQIRYVSLQEYSEPYEIINFMQAYRAPDGVFAKVKNAPETWSEWINIRLVRRVHTRPEQQAEWLRMICLGDGPDDRIKDWSKAKQNWFRQFTLLHTLEQLLVYCGDMKPEVLSSLPGWEQTWAAWKPKDFNNLWADRLDFPMETE